MALAGVFGHFIMATIRITDMLGVNSDGTGLTRWASLGRCHI
jgi:hypothetical protein